MGRRSAIYPYQRTGDRWTKPNYLYVIIDAEKSKVLYVGISMDPRNRMRQHMRKPWFPDRVSMDFHGPMTREDALIWEGVLIAKLHPPYNNHPGYWLCEDGRFTIYGSKPEYAAS
jgi:Nuclease subunit of the excinuclease complex